MNNIQIALNKAICKKMAQKKKEYDKKGIGWGGLNACLADKNLYFAEVYTTYIGRYVTKIFVTGYGDVYQNDGTELDKEGIDLVKVLKLKGCEIEGL